MSRFSEIKNKRRGIDEEEKNASSSTKNTSTNNDSFFQKKKKEKLVNSINIDTLQSDITSLNNTINSAYNGWQTRETMENTLSSIKNMYNRLGKYQEYTSKYGGTDLSELHQAYKGVLDGWDGLSREYSKTKNADEYNKMVQSAKERLAEDEKAKTDDLGKVKTEIDELEKIYNDVKKYDDDVKKLLPNGATRASNDPNKLARLIKEAETKRDDYAKSIGYESYEALENLLGKKKNYYNRAQWIQKGINLASPSAEDKDFEKKSQYVQPEEKYGIQFVDNNEDIYKYINDEVFRDDYISSIESSGEAAMASVGYEYMTDEEKKQYNYYYNSGDKKKAREYLNTITESLGARKAVADYESYKGNTAKELLFGVNAGLDQFAQGIKNVFNSNDEYIPVNATQQLSGMIRDDLNYEHGNWGKVPYDFVTTTSNMLPSILTSTLIGKVNPGLGAKVGSALMGASAGGNAYQEMVNLGYDPKQARAYALLVGVSESSLQNMMGGIGKLGGVGGKLSTAIKSIDNAFARFAINYGGSMVAEGIEEATQEVLNPIFKDLAAGYDTGEKIDWGEVVYSGLLGAMSGGLWEGGPAISNARAEVHTGKNIKTNERVSDMFDLANNPEIAEAYETYTRYANKGITAENVSNAQLGRLYNEVKSDAVEKMNSKNSTDEQRTSGLETLGKLALMKTENTIAKEKSKLTVGEETKVTETGEAIDIKSLTVKGEDVVLSTEKGNISTDEITLTDTDADLVAHAKLIARTDGEDIANLFLSQYDGKMDIDEYENSFNLTVAYGKNDFSFKTILENKGKLTTDQVNAIYAETRIKADKENREAIKRLNEEMSDGKFYKGFIDESVINYGEEDVEGKVKWTSLTERQRQAVTFIKGFAQATGMNLVFWANNHDNNGKYVKATNTMYINLDEGGYDTIKNIKETIIPTMSHETTHWMKKKSPELWRNLNEIVFSTLTDHYNSNTEKAIKDKIELLKWLEPRVEHTEESVRERKITEEDLIQAEMNRNGESESVSREEIIARACEDILSMSEQGRKIFKSLSENEQKTLVEKIKAIINDLLNWVDELLHSYKATSKEAQIMREYKDELQKAVKVWDKMLEESVVANQTFEKSGAYNHDGNVENELYSRKIDRKSKSYYNEYQTNALIWAKATERQPGDLKILNANGKYFALIEATEDGFIELAKGNYKEMKSKYEQAYADAVDEIYGNLESYEADKGRDNWDMQFYGEGGNGNGNHQQVKSQRLQDNSTRNNEHLRNSNKGKLGKSEINDGVRYSKKDDGVETQVNTSMTMDDAKQMIQRAFILGGIKEFYEGEYKDGDEWLRGEGASEVALYIENEYTLTEKYLNKIQSYIDGEFYVEDILEAYLKGTLVGREKPKTKRLDLGQEYRINDKRFYSPQQIKNAKRLLSVAMQKVTNINRKEVSNARAKILLFAHNKGASELLGLSQAELNKKLRAWSNYSAKARDISKRFNNGVADSNKWTGIENCSWLYKSTIETKDLEKLVKDIKGAASDYEKMYVARTMLALDTHIDWSWLSFEFDTYNNVNKDKTFSMSKCLGYYTNESKKIVVTHDKPNTVAHEMGHALDYQWARDLGYNYGALTEVSINTKAITDSATRQFFDNFRIFIDSLTDNGDIRTEYTQNPKEVFARFVARFVEWVDNTGTGRNTYNTESFYYNDKFTASHYIEFVKLLQEKSMLDSRKAEELHSDDNTVYSEKITIDMSDEERANILRNRSIANIPTVNEIPTGIIKKLNNISSWEDVNTLYGKDKRRLIHKIAQEFDAFKDYNNSDINISFEFSNNNFREAYGKQKRNYENFAKMFSVFDKVIENAIGIEVHNRNNEGYKPDVTLNNVYVLLSAFEDGEMIVPVKLEVKEFKDKQNTLYVAISLEAIKKTEVSKQGTTENSVAQNSRSVNISIPDIFAKINPKDTNFLKYIPNEFLSEEQIKAKSIALEIEKRKYSDDTVYSKKQQSIYDTMGETERVAKENEKLKADIERLKELRNLEKKVTHGKELNNNQILSAAAHLRNISKSDIDKVELAKSLKGLYSFINQAEHLTWEEVYGKSYSIAEEMLKESRPEVVVNDYTKHILREIKNQRISLSEAQKKEAGYIFGKNWNRNFFGKVVITDDAISLERQWQEWASEYPDIFKSDISDTDMIVELYDIIGSLQDASETIVEYDMLERTRWLANEIYNQYWNVSPIRTTADKYDKQIRMLKAEHKRTMSELREDRDTRLKEQHKVDKEKYNKLVKDLRERKDKQIALAKQRGEERLSKYKENAQRKTYIQRITANALSLNDMLKKNSKDKHIPDAMKNTVQELLTAINFSSKRLLENGVPTQKDERLANALKNLNKEILEQSTGIKETLDDMYASEIDKKTSKLVESVDKIMKNIKDNEFILNKMSAEDLKRLDEIIKIVKATVNRVNKFHVAQHNAGVESLGIQSTQELNSRKKIHKDNKKHFDKLKTLTFWNNLNPYYAFKHLGEGAQKIFKAFMDGQDKIAFLAKEIIEFTESLYTDKEYKKWSKTFFDFEVTQPNGEVKKFSMNVPQIMSLYCVTKQEDAIRHILHGDENGEGGGITIVETDKTEAVRNNIRLKKADLDNIIDKLNDKEKVGNAKEIADKLQEFMGTRGAELGNEISMARWGIKSFGIENYFPIKVSDGAVPDKSDTPGVQGNPLIALLNMSFTHSRNEYAKQSIEIGDVFDVFANHMSSMIQYNAMALPVLDMYKWMNCKGTDEHGNEFSVKTSVKDTFGDYAWDYLNKFMKDVNGTTKDITRDKMGLKFFRNAKIAKVANNIRVVLLQFTSYIRAGAVLDNKYLLRALLHKPKIEKSQTYCGMALFKSLGYYDTDITRPLTDKIKHATSTMDKIYDFQLKGAEVADKITLGYLWNACELEVRETRKDLKVGSDEFFKEIGLRLREVIYRTQVVDSQLTRSQMMRGSAWDKMLTSFASENALSFNLVTDVFVTYKLDERSMGKEKAIEKNKTYARKAITAYVVGNLVSAAIQTMFDAFRDYDEDDKDEEYYAKLMIGNFANNVSFINKLPYINLLVSAISGFSGSRLEGDWMEETAKALREISKLAVGKGSVENLLRYIEKAASDATGVGVYNLNRDLRAMCEMFEDFLD